MERVARIVILSDSGGSPVGGAVVTVARATISVPELAYVTGDDGRVRIGLPPGPALLSVALPSGEVRTIEVAVGDEAEGVLSMTIEAGPAASGPR
ncbi:MAG TPA: hypothetical protein VGU24_22020 [Microvirga sp.]|jgi:hypothetical protein|nr:hypothetical protein [Microvirga sp.]